MTNTTKTLLKQLLLSLCCVVPFTQANALTLDNWNVTELNDSGDSIDVTFGTTGTYTWFSAQWEAGANNGLQALGLDTFFYNCDNCSLSQFKGDDASTFGGVYQVWTGSTAGALTNNITSDWDANFGGTTGGGGFGEFTSRKSLDSAGTDGINNFITFLLNDNNLTFSPNSNGSTMDVHVRYEQSCSGWVSDGTTSPESNGSCGGGGSVPEPTPLVLLAIGMGLLGVSRKVWAVTRT
jgi:hypothetical protein